MAIEKRIKIVVDGKDAVKEVDEIKKGVDGIDEGAKNSKSSFLVMKRGVQGVGLALKAIGIGLIVAAFVQLGELFKQNQVVMDKLSVAGTAIKFVLQKVVDVAVELGGTLFKAFDDPQQAIKDFWAVLKQNIVNRIEGLIDTFGALGKMIRAVFKKDLEALKEAASDAGTAFIQLNTGLDETQQTKFADAVKEGAKELKKATKEGVEYGKVITKMRNEVKLAEANQRALQLTYQKDAELQRQIRDDISLTMEERIAANTELGRILDEQFAEEEALAQKKIDLAQKELDQNETNIDLQVALINAKTEMADLEERITGQRSEQMVNENALIKEGIDLENQKIEANAKLKEQEVKDANDALERAKKKKDQDIKDAKAELIRNKKLQEAKVAAVTGAMGAIAGAIGKETKAGKTLAIGQAIIDTYVGANKALAQGGILGFAGAAGIIATGLANVKTILATDVGGDGGGGAAPASSTQATAPEIGGVGGSLIPNMESIIPGGANGMQPVQAYVVETDISDSQALQEELDIQATL